MPGEPAETAIPRLMAEYGAKIYQLGLRLCGKAPDAEDLAQETFLQAFRKWGQFEGRSEESTWLFTIAARLCRRRQRRRSGEPRRLEPLEGLLPYAEAQIPDPDSELLAGPLRREAREAVEAALPRIPFAFRLPLVLKEIAELSLAEVAAVLGLQEATVKTRIHRARLALRRELAARLPRRPAPPPGHSRQVCLDLLRAKQEALDRGVELPLAPGQLCDRCRSLFSTLDLAQDLCRELGRGGGLPPRLRRLVERAPAS